MLVFEKGSEKGSGSEKGAFLTIDTNYEAAEKGSFLTIDTNYEAAG